MKEQVMETIEIQLKKECISGDGTGDTPRGLMNEMDSVPLAPPQARLVPGDQDSYNNEDLNKFTTIDTPMTGMDRRPDNTPPNLIVSDRASRDLSLEGGSTVMDFGSTHTRQGRGDALLTNLRSCVIPVLEGVMENRFGYTDVMFWASESKPVLLFCFIDNDS
jgi:hypothetical protein